MSGIAPEHLCPSCVKKGTPECRTPAVPGTVVEVCHLYSRGTGSWQLTDIPLMSDEDRKKQVGGSHYKDHRFQPWDIILEYKLDYWEGNALKYLLRRKSNRLEDLEKAKHYLEECIRQLKANDSKGND